MKKVRFMMALDITCQALFCLVANKKQHVAHQLYTKRRQQSSMLLILQDRLIHIAWCHSTLDEHIDSYVYMYSCIEECNGNRDTYRVINNGMPMLHRRLHDFQAMCAEQKNKPNDRKL